MEQRYQVLATELDCLCVLAHTGWMSQRHLHQLCFPQHVERTAVLATLRGMAHPGCGWVMPLRWRLGANARDAVWAITPAGIDVVARYRWVPRPMVLHDLRRPPTVLAEAEWSAQRHMRDIVVALVTTARRQPFLHTLSVTLACWPPGSDAGGADATIQVAWVPATAHTDRWLPWPVSNSLGPPALNYSVYVGRSMGRSCLDRIADVPPALGAVPLIIATDREQFTRLLAELARMAPTMGCPIGIGYLDDLLQDCAGAVWHTANGRRMRMPQITKDVIATYQ